MRKLAPAKTAPRTHPLADGEQLLPGAGCFSIVCYVKIVVGMRGRSLELERLEDAVRQIVTDLELYSYYQLLDVTPEVSCAVAEYNFNVKVHEYRKIQKDHRCGAALFQALSLIMERMDEAKQVLSDAKLRAEYDRGLEEGQTRHQGVVRERAAQHKSGSDGTREEVLERLSSKLQQTIDKELLQAQEAEVADISDGIEADLLDQESQSLRDELAGYGVAIDVSAMPVEGHQPIEAEYLDKASRHLRRQIYKAGATLHEAVDAEDVSAGSDDELVSGLTEQLRHELQSMGIPEKEEVESEALPPDAETLERLVRQEQKAVLELKVDTTVKADDEQQCTAIDRTTAERLSESLEKDLSQRGVTYAVPANREGEPELAPIPIDLSEPPSAAGTSLSLPKSVQPSATTTSPTPAWSRAGLGGRDPAEELEHFDLVIPLDEEAGGAESQPKPAQANKKDKEPR